MSGQIRLKYEEMLALRKRADEAEAVFRKIAEDIAHKRAPLASCDSIVFKEDKVFFSCRGTGIYSHDEWMEEFPVELLLQRAAEVLNP
jgi:hypothetical protein